MPSPRDINTDLNSVKQIRSRRRKHNGGWRSPHRTVAGKILIGVTCVCLIGGIIAAIIVSLRSAGANAESENIVTTTSTSTLSNTTTVTITTPITTTTTATTTTTVMTTMSTTTTTTMTTTTTSGTFTYRGLYVDGFNSILGDESSENSLLNWTVNNNFNAISLYDLNTILANTIRWANLSRFIKKARITYHIDQIAAIRGASADFIQNGIYDSSRTDPNERFTVYNLEREWWNNCSGCNFSFYTTILQTMHDQAKNITPSIITEIYMGWFKNPEGQDFVQANTLVGLLDRILIHDYQTSPGFGYLQNRTTYLGEAANSQNGTVDLIVIFSAEYAFMFNYFNATGPNHMFENAYATVLSQFNATSFNYKTSVRFIGYQIYCYSYARAARP